MKPSLILATATLMLSLTAEADSSLKTAQAEYRQIPLVHQLDGVVEAVNQGTLSAQTQGQVMEILYDVDDFVEQDSLVIRLKDTEHLARLTQAKAELRAAKARLEEAQNEQKRIAAVFEKGLISSSNLDQANAGLEAAKARSNAAIAGLEQAEEQLGYTRIKAPFSGIVTQRHIEVGETANPGQQLMSGLSLDKLRINVDVPQSLIPTIRKNKKARIELPDGKIVEAASLTIFPFAQAGSNTFKVRLGLPDGISELFPGMFVKSSFIIGSQQRLLIPQKSVVFRSEVTGTYVVNPKGQISFRYIRLGHKTEDGMISILAGLYRGEKVALDPVTAGARLKKQAGGQQDG